MSCLSRVSLLFASVALFTSCKLPVNTRMYEVRNVVCEAKKGKDGSFTNYRWLQVGNYDRPYNGFPLLKVRLSDGSVLPLTEVTLSKLRPSDKHLSEGNLSSPWPPGTNQVRTRDYVFILNANKVLSFEAAAKGPGYYDLVRKVHVGPDPDALPAAIGLSNGNLYEMPLKEEQVELIFGKPTRVRDVFRE